MKCADCGMPYSEMGVDLVLPDQVWNAIANPSEILCANCICQRLETNSETTAVLAWPDRFAYPSEFRRHDVQTRV